VDTDAQTAVQISNRARLAVESLSQQQDSATSGRKITASFGVSTITFGTVDVADLLNQADQALYESKHKGRNRVTNWVGVEASQLEAN
jgi:diguanylate cyclase (GGDEF)-like protein